MTPDDLSRLRSLVGLPESYRGFNPLENPGDAVMVEEKLLSDGFSIRISKYGSCYRAIIDGPRPLMAEAPTRREALCLAALGALP